MVVVGNITRQIIDNAIEEIKKDENMKKITDNIIDPIIYYSVSRIYPYIIFTAALFILTLLIAIVILVILIKKK